MSEVEEDTSFDFPCRFPGSIDMHKCTTKTLEISAFNIAGISNKSNPIHILVTNSLLHFRVGGTSNQ